MLAKEGAKAVYIQYSANEKYLEVPAEPAYFPGNKVLGAQCKCFLSFTYNPFDGLAYLIISGDYSDNLIDTAQTT